MACLLGGVLLLLAAVACLNWVVDPLMLNRSERWVPDDYQHRSRTQQLRRIAERGAGIDVLVLGSSTARNVDPKVIEARTGRATHNGSVSGGRIEEALAAWRRARASGSRPDLVLLVDLEAMFATRDPNGAVLQEPGIRDELPVGARIELMRRLLAGLVTEDTTLLSRDWLRRTKLAPDRGRILRPDGFRLFDINKGGAPQVAQQLATTIETYHDQFYDQPGFASHLDYVEVGLLELLLAEAEGAGVDARMVIMPAHPDFTREFGAARVERRRVVRAMLAASAARHGALLLDASAQAGCAPSEEQFLDGLHLDVEASSALVGSTLQARRPDGHDRPAAGCAVSFGPDHGA